MKQLRWTRDIFDKESYGYLGRYCGTHLRKRGKLWLGILTAMTLGMLQGILSKLYEMYVQICEKTGKKAAHLVGSGNGIRKNPLMRELAEELFGLKMEIPVCQEEAAYGAALHALAAAGVIAGIEDAQKNIQYY